ncbi:Uncharacterized protein GBIM_13555, partial [Gryllus bimaculatus]
RDKCFREKEVHLIHLRSLEEELDMQVARVEQQVREEARTKYEAEKRALQERMETEIAELQTHLRLFQKVNKALSRKSGENQPDERHEAAMENRQLRQMQEETVSEYRQQNDLVHRQLDLLHEANSRMQDTNDSLLSVLELPETRSPRPASPCCCS